VARTVDRSTARLIAYKRLVTGSMSVVAGFITIGVVVLQERPFRPMVALALALFFGGGAWTLRDGLRLRRELGR
jgi:hypothetical protein